MDQVNVGSDQCGVGSVWGQISAVLDQCGV